MLVKLNYTYNPAYGNETDNHRHRFTSEMIGNYVCEIVGKGDTKKEAMCDFESQLTRFITDVMKMIGVTVYDCNFELTEIK